MRVALLASPMLVWERRSGRGLWEKASGRHCSRRLNPVSHGAVPVRTTTGVAPGTRRRRRRAATCSTRIVELAAEHRRIERPQSGPLARGRIAADTGGGTEAAARRAAISRRQSQISLRVSSSAIMRAMAAGSGRRGQRVAHLDANGGELAQVGELGHHDRAVAAGTGRRLISRCRPWPRSTCRSMFRLSGALVGYSSMCARWRPRGTCMGISPWRAACWT